LSLVAAEAVEKLAVEVEVEAFDQQQQQQAAEAP
jgi:hypothetical protein